MNPRRPAGPDDGALEHDARLANVVRELRRGVPVDPRWRESVLAGVRQSASPRRRPWFARRTTIVAWTAAAALVMAVAGTFAVRQGPASGTVGSAMDNPPGVAVVRFAFADSVARNVSVVGDFNAWNPSALPMRRSVARGWVAEMPLSPGRHLYAFYVDGRLAPDPMAPRATDDDFGVASSMMFVTEPRR